MWTDNVNLPPMIQLEKDYKTRKLDGSRSGHLLCLARSTPKEVWSDIVSEFCNKVSDAVQSSNECFNTEETCAGICEVNQMIDNNNEGIEVGSIDAKALHPSLRRVTLRLFATK